MSNRAEYMALTRLRDNADYKLLQARWLDIISDIESSRDRAGARASEGNWKYYAGQEKGSKRIVMALDLAISALEATDNELAEENRYDELLNEVIPGRNK